MTTLRRQAALWLTALAAGVAGAATLSGTVTAGGAPLAGVAVSDGVSVAVTDAHGRYSLESDKELGYVFYSLPGGYEPALADGFNPQFWSHLNDPRPDVDETHDFALMRASDDGTRHAMIIAADTHLARRNSDLSQFQYTFMPSLKREVRRLRQDGGYATVHSTILGDLTWDTFWRSNDFDLHDFMAFMSTCRWPVTMWPVIGNHDNDPSVPAGATTDHDAAAPWRDIVCPTYYSFNIGRVHYVVLDDILYLNEALDGGQYSDDVAGSHNFEARLTATQLAWLDADLALVADDRPVVVCLHIPVWQLNSRWATTARLTGADELCRRLDRFAQALIVSGHTHINATMHPAGHPTVTERNIGAVCASWWWTGRYTGRNVCIDGSPAGYELLEVDGDRLTWQYRSVESDVAHAQMRVYDMNTVRDFYRSNATMQAIMTAYPTRQDYGTMPDNMVMVNVFNYDSRTWRVDIYEGDNRLWWSREAAEDPLHTLCYEVPRFADVGSYTEMFATSRNQHTFTAQATTATLPITVRVTDGQGRTFIKCVDRPAAYSPNMDALQKPLAPGDVNRDGTVDVGDVNAVLARILGGSGAAVLPLADVNADGIADVGDVNAVLDIILRDTGTADEC